MFTDGGDWTYLDIFGIQNDFSRLLSRIEMLFVKSHFPQKMLRGTPARRTSEKWFSSSVFLLDLYRAAQSSVHAKTIFKVALPTCREIQIKFYLFLVKSTRRRSNQHAAMGRFLNPPNMHDNSPDYLISVLCRAIVTSSVRSE